MTTTLKYNLRQISDIACSGFQFEMSEDTYNMINYLSTQVGAIGLTSPTFVRQKRDPVESSAKDIDNDFSSSSANIKNKKKKGNRGMEVSGEEWETIRTFQTTKIEQKSGIDGDIDHIRLLLNKLTDNVIPTNNSIFKIFICILFITDV